MFRSRKNAIITGAVVAVAVGFACSTPIILSAESGGNPDAGGNWGNVAVLTLVVGIFTAVFAFFQTWVLFAIKQLGNQMTEMDRRLTNQISEDGKRSHERFLLIEERFTQLENRMEARFTQVEERFTQIDARFTQIDARFVQLESRLDARFAQIDARFAQIDARFTQIEDRFAHLENRMEARFAQMEERFTQIDIRLDSLQRNYVDDMKYHLREE